MPTFPFWWNWELFFTKHMRRRMPQRKVTELDLRAMLERAKRLEPDEKTSGRFLVYTRHAGQPWLVVVEPEADTRRLAVITAFDYANQ
jgi:hypothetical protein